MAALDEVAAEMTRQFDLWGDQSRLPDGTGNASDRAEALDWKRKNKQALASNTLSMRLILLEEVWEAMAEKDSRKLREELVQVAAVACTWVEYLDKRGAK